MPKRIDHTGKRFGQWLVLRYIGRNQSGRSFYECQCDCGRIVGVDAGNLVFGSSIRCKSCGQRLSEGEAAFNRLYTYYQLGAKKRNITWNLSKDEFRQLTSSNCHYTGRKPAQVSKGLGGDYVYNGVDRVDNSRGYELDNCVPCCGKVNEMKMDSKYEDFLAICKEVVEHRIGAN